jgi:hypothetical protein
MSNKENQSLEANQARELRILTEGELASVNGGTIIDDPDPPPGMTIDPGRKK